MSCIFFPGRDVDIIQRQGLLGPVHRRLNVDLPACWTYYLLTLLINKLSVSQFLGTDILLRACDVPSIILATGQGEGEKWNSDKPIIKVRIAGRCLS